MRLLLLLTFFIPALLMSQSKEDARKLVWKLLEANNQDAYTFMKELYDLPTKFKLGNSTLTTSKASDFMVYVRDYTKEGVLSSISTAVHEACHMYQSQKAYSIIDERDLLFNFEDSYTVYFINANEEILVKETPVFPSVKIVSEIPRTRRTSRFDTYINSRNTILGTQQSGIYGLMEEWSAYMNGFKTTLRNFPEYKKEAESNPAYFLNFVSDAASIRISYYEFKFYILEYLRYASRKEKKIYQEILKNEDFKKAYRSIDAGFSALLTEHERLFESIKSFADEKGESTRMMDGYFFIGTRGVGLYTDEQLELETVIKSAEYVNIETLLIR